MKRLYKYILYLSLVLTVGYTARAEEKPVEVTSQEQIDVKEIIFSHIGDSYQWHITTWGDIHVTIPLPVIVRGENGQWHLFSSSHLYHGEGSYQGFSIAQEGKHAGKIVEYTADGEAIRPIDLSLTKNALALLINSTILICIVLSVARWYRKRPKSVPKGFVGAVEMFVMEINDDLIKPCIGKGYERYAPYLLTAFFFILVNNLMGLIPFFPGGASTTGNIAITIVLGVCTFLAVNIWGTKEYWKEVFWPDVPTWMKVPIPLMPAVELFGVFTKPFALIIRLFANMMAGHAIILSLTCMIFITVAMGPVINTSMTIVSVLMSIFMNCLELLVAYIQAYVFTMLSAVFIGLSRVEPHKQH